MTRNDIMAHAQNVCDNLANGGILDNEITITEGTVLLGEGAEFDSIAFVTFFMELEDKLNEITGEEMYFVIDEIDEFNLECEALTVGVVISYIISLLGKNELN